MNKTLFAVDNSDKQIFASLENNTLKTAAGSPVHPGMILTFKGRSFFVLATGDHEHEVAEIRATSPICEKHHRHAVGGVVEEITPTAQPLPILEQRGDTLTVPRRHAANVGRIVKSGSDLLEVISARIDGAKAILSTRPYTPPIQKNLGRPQARPLGFSGAPTAMPWNSSMLR